MRKYIVRELKLIWFLQKIARLFLKQQTSKWLDFKEEKKKTKTQTVSQNEVSYATQYFSWQTYKHEKYLQSENLNSLSH